MPVAPKLPVYTLGRPDPQDRSQERTVCSGLSLWLPLKSPALMGPLLQDLQLARPVIDEALARLHYVHFSRFLPAPDWSALQVITEFDGDFDAYVLDFVHVLGPQFDRILRDVQGAPAFKTQDRPDLFIEFIRRHQLGVQGPLSLPPVRQNSAYRDKTVIDLIGNGGVFARPAPTPTPSDAVDTSDVQANLLHGLNADFARHVGLRIDNVQGARGFMDDLLTGAQGCPVVSDGRPWPTDAQGHRQRPPYQLTVGLTYKALVWLGIGDADQAAFARAHPAFVRGPDHAGSAARLGDIGSSHPAQWRLGGPQAQVHIVVSLYGWDNAELATQQAALTSAAGRRGLGVVQVETAQALRDVARADAKPDRASEHFGFIDDISEPHLAVAGAAEAKPGAQPSAPVGEVLLGQAYTNTYRGLGSLTGLSPALAQNATFAALRVMEQDVERFERLLADGAAKSGQSADWVAAKLMGRWRNGVPLHQNPTSDTPVPGLDLDLFDYAQREGDTTTVPDDKGLACPIGSHIRRMNPRSGIVAGQPYSRRMLRRGMPYGPRYQPGNPASAAADRGLIGLFLCSDLDRQFEFVLRHWAQGDIATTGIRGQQDPIIGAQTTLDHAEDSRRPMTGTFSIPLAGDTHVQLTVPRLVHTRGSAYLFMPGRGGLRHLAGLTTPPAPLVQLPNGQHRLYDPADRTVYTDPFAWFDWLRSRHPVLHLPALRTVWVFSHAAVAAAVARPDQFRRQRPGLRHPAGLLKMDGTGHAKARAAIVPLFRQATAGVQAGAAATVAARYPRPQGQPQPFDWVTRFARPLAEDVFSAWFGLAAAQVDPLLTQAAEVLAAASPNDDTAADQANADMGDKVRRALFTPGAMVPGGLLARLYGLLVASGQPPAEPSNSFGLIEYVTQVTTMALAGFLPVYWGVSLVTWRLLENNGAALDTLRADPTITSSAAVAELLRLDTPTPMSTRYVHEAGDLEGVPLRVGDKLMLSWVSANRDPLQAGANPDRLDFKRNSGRTWSFGNSSATASGDSFECLGRDLSEAVLVAVVDALRTAPKPPSLPASGGPEWHDTAMFRAMAKLMLQLP